MPNAKLVKMKSLFIVSTVPQTIRYILKDQPRFLSSYFCVNIVSSTGVEDIDEGVPVHKVEMQRGISIIEDFISLYRMILLFMKYRPDIVHSFTPKAGLIAMLAAFVCRVPNRIHTFTGLIFPTSRGFKRKVVWLMDKLICFCATLVIPEGEGVKNDLLKYRVTRKELKVIGSGNIAGVDLDFFNQDLHSVTSDSISLRQRLCISDSDFIFCFIGRINVDKGICELISSFLSLESNSRLIVVGDIERENSISVEYADLLMNSERIHYLGFLQDIRPVLRLSNVLVLPSYREGFPNVVLQAGAMNVPVIATDINGCNEVIQEKFNGWLVPVKNSDALTVAMLSAMKLDSASMLQMRRNSRIRVEARFERTAHWKRMAVLYSNIS